MPTLNPNVMFKGNCEQAFDFYQTIFWRRVIAKNALE